ncbi:MAG TPA: asparagine synthase (glutamine-hydrolyzing), partial [Candidatus Limnocylindrales bacterium]|nr:asparagine synthase (glutamine-hydrolyzing) [Candidatus Limnocylindrales bacterium]
MCGIAGIIDFKAAVSRSTIEAMCCAIHHRGPDHSGLLVQQGAQFSLGLGSQRLSIIDLSDAGNMPICNEAGDVWIVYNGELYNHRELRAELEARGHQYSSNTDTETIVHAYEEYGLNCLKRFNGMFAFALYDQRNERVVLARDPMGIKPLHYAWDGNRLTFCSELRGLFAAEQCRPPLDPVAVNLYLSLGYIPSPHSIYSGVRKLPPGASLVIENRTCTLDMFWTPQLRPSSDGPRDLDSLTETTRTVIEDAVVRQLMSDVPVGVFLSGGLDSSIVTVLAQRHHGDVMDTFSVGFGRDGGGLDTRDLYNQDLVHARAVAAAMGTRHHEVVVPTDDRIAGLIMDTLAHMDEPVWESSFVSLHVMSRLARDHGVKVVLTGDGGDELFGGYPWYFGAQRFERLQRLPFLQHALPFLQAIGGSSILAVKARDLRLRLRQDDIGRYRINHDIFSEIEKHDLIGTNAIERQADDPVSQYVRELFDASGAETWTERLAMADLTLWVRDHFNQRVDRMSMMNSIEARVPLQDQQV